MDKLNSNTEAVLFVSLVMVYEVFLFFPSEALISHINWDDYLRYYLSYLLKQDAGGRANKVLHSVERPCVTFCNLIIFLLPTRSVTVGTVPTLVWVPRQRFIVSLSVKRDSRVGMELKAKLNLMCLHKGEPLIRLRSHNFIFVIFNATPRLWTLAMFSQSENK